MLGSMFGGGGGGGGGGTFANISSAGCRTYAVPEYHRYVL